MRLHAVRDWIWLTGLSRLFEIVDKCYKIPDDGIRNSYG